MNNIIEHQLKNKEHLASMFKNKSSVEFETIEKAVQTLNKSFVDGNVKEELFDKAINVFKDRIEKAISNTPHQVAIVGQRGQSSFMIVKNGKNFKQDAIANIGGTEFKKSVDGWVLNTHRQIEKSDSGDDFVLLDDMDIEKALDPFGDEMDINLVKGGARVPVGTVVTRKNGIKEMKTETGWKYMGKEKKGKGDESGDEGKGGSILSKIPNMTNEELEDLIDQGLEHTAARAELKKRSESSKRSKPKSDSSEGQKAIKKSTIKKLNDITFSLELETKYGGVSTFTTKTKEEAEAILKKLETADSQGKIESMSAMTALAYGNEKKSDDKGGEKKQPRVLSKLEPFLKEEGDRNLRMTNWHIGGVVGTISSIFEDYDKSLVDFKEEAIKFFEKKAPNARRDVEDHLNRGAISNVSPNDFVELYGIFQKNKDKMPENWQNRFETKFRKGFNSMLEDAEKGRLTKKPKEEEKPQKQENKKSLTDKQVIDRLSTWMRDMDEDDMKDVYTGIVPKNKVNAAADGSYNLTPEEDKKLIDKYKKIFSED